jgi:SHS2 domain-containing protein
MVSPEAGVRIGDDADPPGEKSAAPAARQDRRVHRWLDNTAELELTVEAPTEEAVLAEAAVALGELLTDEPEGEPARREVAVSAPDEPALLAEWLNELVFLSETESFVPERVVELELSAGRLRALVDGRIAAPKTLVKAVTYHGLVLEREGVGWRGRATLDV